MADLRAAIRSLVRERAYFGTAVLTFGAGVLLVTAAFTLTDGVLFRPLPYGRPQHLVNLFGASRRTHDLRISVSETDFEAYATAHALSGATAFTASKSSPARVPGTGGNLLAVVGAVSPTFFDVLQVHAQAGREFTASDFEGAAPRVAMISDALFRKAFDGQPAALGSVLHRSSYTLTVIGVLPRDFVFPERFTRFAPDVLVPLIPGSPDMGSRSDRTLDVIARLAPGVTPAAAQAELDGIARSLMPSYAGPPEVIPGPFDGVTIVPTKELLTAGSLEVARLVFFASCLILLLACTNTVVLMLSRGVTRRREFRTRMALGASRASLVRLGVIESVLVSIVGGVCSAGLLPPLFAALASNVPQSLQLLGTPAVEWRSLMFALAATVTAGVVGGLLSGVVLATDVPIASTASVRGPGTALRVFIAAEVAIVVSVLTFGALTLRSIALASAENLGYDADRVVKLRVVPSMLSDPRASAGFARSLTDRLRGIADVDDVAWTNAPLLEGGLMTGTSAAPPPGAAPGPHVTDEYVTTNFFDVMGIRLVSGRLLTPADTDRRVVISETLARRWWPTKAAVGQIVRYRDGLREVVGVVNDVRDASPDLVPYGILYRPWSAGPSAPHYPSAFVVRVRTTPSATTLEALRRAAREGDSGAVVTFDDSLRSLAALALGGRAFDAKWFGMFAAAGLGIAVVGLFALVSYAAAAERRALAIRAAIGATPRHVAAALLRPTLVSAGIGSVLGLLLSAAGAHLMQSLLYGVTASDPWSRLLAVAILGVTAVAALAIPVRAAITANPSAVLRQE